MPDPALLMRLAQIHAASFTTPPPWDAPALAGMIEVPHDFLLTARQTGPISGFLIGRALAGEAELLTLAVDPASRRGGIGRGLADGFMAEARKRGAERAFLEVSVENPAAIALYESLGFATSGRRRGYYRKPEGSRIDALVMQRLIG